MNINHIVRKISILFNALIKSIQQCIKESPYSEYQKFKGCDDSFPVDIFGELDKKDRFKSEEDCNDINE